MTTPVTTEASDRPLLPEALMTPEFDAGADASESEPERPDTAERDRHVEELIERAIRSQRDEQRELREALRELTESVRELADTEIDTEPFAELVDAAMRRSAGATIAEVRELRDAVRSIEPPILDIEPVARIVSKELDAVHESIGNTAADIEGIAQALIDLNAGLRDWAGGVDRNIGSLADTITEIRDLALQSNELHADVIDELRAQAQRAAEPSQQTVADRAEIDQRLKESEELSLYLADQIEDFDRSLQRITDLPAQLEGVVSQALKRTLSAKAKLDKDTEATLNDTLTALAENIDRMDEAVEQLSSSEESLRVLARDQSELSSRVDSLHADLTQRLEEIVRKAPASAPKRRAKPSTTAEKDLPAARKRPPSKRAAAGKQPDDRTDDD